MKVKVLLISAERVDLLNRWSDARVGINVPLGLVSAVVEITEWKLKLVRLTACRAGALHRKCECLSDEAKVGGAVVGASEAWVCGLGEHEVERHRRCEIKLGRHIVKSCRRIEEF